jgi:hypothetical protein
MNFLQKLFTKSSETKKSTLADYMRDISEEVKMSNKLDLNLQDYLDQIQKRAEGGYTSLVLKTHGVFKPGQEEQFCSSLRNLGFKTEKYISHNYPQLNDITITW